MGLRATLPVFENQPLKRVDDTISLSIGLDWVRYGSYHPTGAGSTNVTTDAFYVPLSIPFDERTTFPLSGGRFSRSATLPNYVFDNNNVMFGVSWRF